MKTLWHKLKALARDWRGRRKMRRYAADRRAGEAARVERGKQKTWVGPTGHVAAAAGRASAVKTIAVPTSHYDDFVRHRGWWAVFEDPGLQPGDPVRFAVGDYCRVDATVKAVFRDDPRFPGGWWTIEYATRKDGGR